MYIVEQDNRLQELIDKQRQIFEWVEKLKHFELKLYIDKNEAPVKQPPVRQAHHLQGKVEQILNDVEPSNIMKR